MQSNSIEISSLFVSFAVIPWFTSKPNRESLGPPKFDSSIFIGIKSPLKS